MTAGYNEEVLLSSRIAMAGRQFWIKHIESFERKTRNVLIMDEIHLSKADIDRLYIYKAWVIELQSAY